MSYLVDTSVFSELAKSKPEAHVVTWLRDNEPELYISAITIGELRRGIEGLASGRRKEGLQTWLVGLGGRMEGRILNFNTSTAHVWGQLIVKWQRCGVMISSLDSQIAAIAYRHGLTIVTRKTSDFRLTGIKLLNPFQA